MNEFSYTDKPIILTACLDDEAQAFFNQKRQEHFPPERNYLEAHLTLFHKLPPENIETIQSRLTELVRKYRPLKAKAADIMFMGFGSAYEIECSGLIDIRGNLAKDWQEWLSPQDAQRFKPHITFQNKVKAELAKEIYANELANFKPFEFEITGLQLWYYDGGPWEHVEDCNFVTS